MLFVDCPDGYHGIGCGLDCGSCLNNEPCHDITGVCPTGCDPGKMGDLCVEGSICSILAMSEMVVIQLRQLEIDISSCLYVANATSSLSWVKYCTSGYLQLIKHWFTWFGNGNFIIISYTLSLRWGTTWKRKLIAWLLCCQSSHECCWLEIVRLCHNQCYYLGPFLLTWINFNPNID